MIIAVLSGFILAFLLVFVGGKLRGWFSLLPGLLPLSLFIYFLGYLPRVGGEGLFFEYQWVPSIGVNLNFRLDGLAMLFALMITGIGTLVFFYTSAYMRNHAHLDRFYGYLSMFMAAMLGLVLSDNLIALFVFWELTSISSFFLIGFNNEDPASRRSSRLALAITGGGGLLLLVGVLLIGFLGQTYSIVELSAVSEMLQSGKMYGWILFLLFGAAFTKSAQFPLHFWLPGAMKAPTPVSTYLHSATMVKAGIYLLARFTPVLGDHEYWNNTLLIVGGFTMLYAAIHAVFRTDMKSILAYSTISALGIMVFLLGMGTAESLLALSVFILVHALYKAALFLVTGVVDHETGTRDVTRLSGLRKVMMPVAVAAGLAALSNAGLPPSFGFIGKDLIYESSLHAATWSYVFTVLAIVTNICLLYAGLVVGLKPFAGKLPEEFSKLHLPSPLMWVPPLLLAVLGIVFGILPGIAGNALIGKVHQSVYPASLGMPELLLWHGFNLVLLLSAITLVGGALLYWLLKPKMGTENRIQKLERLSPQTSAYGLWNLFIRTSATYTNGLQNGFLRYYLMIIVSFLVMMLGYKFFTEVQIKIDLAQFSAVSFYEAVLAALMVSTIIYVVFTRSRLHAVVAIGIVGYTLCLFFMNYGAPDLAMTQFTIDTLTVVMFVLVLYNLPKYLQYSNNAVRLRDGIIGISFGGLITLLAIQVIQEPITRETSQFYAENAYTLARGKNVVNVILVDFRGFDTLGEITVLTIAALGVYSLLKLQIVTKKTKP